MLEDLKFVQGGVARKDFLPELAHFHISNGRITGYNGTMAVSSSIALDMDCNPKAESLVKAIQACTNEVTKLNLTPTGKLSVRSGKFRALVECLDDAMPPPVNLTGDRFDLTEGFIPALRHLKPFISEDASRKWSKGILIRRGCMYATSNVTLVQQWMDMATCPEINIPEMVVNELLRLKQLPEYMRVNQTSVTFFYPNGRWLWSSLYTSEWPEIDHILERPHDSPVPVTAELRDALETLKPFLTAEMRVYCRGMTLATSPVDDDGANVTLSYPIGDGVYNHKQLSLVAGIADTLDISAYPSPATFRGKMLRGALAGMTA